MNQIALVFIGAGIGGVLRFLISRFVVANFGTGFPYGTFAINISGSFLIGIAAGLLSRNPNHQTILQYFVMIGLLGGYTTFSSFSLETLNLIERGQIVIAFAYILLSVLLGLGAVFIGMAISKSLL